MNHILRVDKEVDLLGLQVGVHNSSQVVYHIRQTHFALVEFGSSALNAAHIQHIVDEGKQVIARYGDFLQIISNRISVIDMRRRQGSKAYDGIHWRTDIMAHAVEEGGLSLIGMIGHRQRLFKQSVVALQLFLPLLLYLLLHIDVKQGKQADGFRFLKISNKRQAQPPAAAELKIIEQVYLFANRLQGGIPDKVGYPRGVSLLQKAILQTRNQVADMRYAREVHPQNGATLNHHTIACHHVNLDDGGIDAADRLYTVVHSCCWLLFMLYGE